MFQVTCSCGACVQFPASQAGKRGRCPRCQTILNIPTSPSDIVTSPQRMDRNASAEPNQFTSAADIASSVPPELFDEPKRSTSGDQGRSPSGDSTDRWPASNDFAPAGGFAPPGGFLPPVSSMGRARSVGQKGITEPIGFAPPSLPATPQSRSQIADERQDSRSEAAVEPTRRAENTTFASAPVLPPQATTASQAETVARADQEPPVTRPQSRRDGHSQHVAGAVVAGQTPTISNPVAPASSTQPTPHSEKQKNRFRGTPRPSVPTRTEPPGTQVGSRESIDTQTARNSLAESLTAVQQAMLNPAWKSLISWGNGGLERVRRSRPLQIGLVVSSVGILGLFLIVLLNAGDRSTESRSAESGSTVTQGIEVADSDPVSSPPSAANSPATKPVDRSSSAEALGNVSENKKAREATKQSRETVDHLIPAPTTTIPMTIPAETAMDPTRQATLDPATAQTQNSMPNLPPESAIAERPASIPADPAVSAGPADPATQATPATALPTASTVDGTASPLASAATASGAQAGSRLKTGGVRTRSELRTGVPDRYTDEHCWALLQRYGVLIPPGADILEVNGEPIAVSGLEPISRVRGPYLLLPKGEHLVRFRMNQPALRVQIEGHFGDEYAMMREFFGVAEDIQTDWLTDRGRRAYDIHRTGFLLNFEGAAYAAKEDWAAAERKFRRTLAVQPTFSPAHLNLAHCLARRGDQAAAAREVRLAQQFNVGNLFGLQAAIDSLARDWKVEEESASPLILPLAEYQAATKLTEVDQRMIALLQGVSKYAVQPSDRAKVLNNLAVHFADRQQADLSLEYFRDALQAARGDSASRSNLVRHMFSQMEAVCRTAGYAEAEEYAAMQRRTR